MAERHVVLVHGAWAGSWVWDRLLDGLRAAGYRPHAVDLPGNGRDDTPATEVSLARYVEHVARVIGTLNGPVHLVGHSGGGLTVTAVAEQLAERIAGASYVAGMMLPSGLAFADLCATMSREYPEARGVGPFLRPSACGRGTLVLPEVALALFFHDAPPEQALAAARRLVTQPDGGRNCVVGWTPERFGRLPRLYVEAARDRSVAPVLQQRMQALVPGAERVVLDCGHTPQLAAPADLLTALLDFFARHPHPVT